MSLDAGDRLAHYEIAEPIGKGGMGEVYRAKDAKLGRDVAIKVLPDEFSRDEERLRRFQREAKVLASLNHPNIAAIYGLEQSGETHYLVLELVPGETLAERIARGPIPLEEALPIARQIAEALEEAHERGIVHRDLKPANIKLTEDGKVKVLDFGLAKAFFDEATDVDSSMSPTITRDATRIGVILGTAAYMSPEQAKGKQVDQRADVWAFGVVLFEMLTGQRAFAAEDVSETLAYVLTRDVDWSLLPANTPEPVRRLLRRSVARDRKQRLGEMATARLEIDEAGEGSSVPYAPSHSSLAAWQKPLRVAVVALVAAAAGALIWLSMSDSSAPSRPVTRFGISLPEGEELTYTARHAVAVAPDGSYIVYNSERRLWMRPVDSLQAVALPGTEYAREPFVSPDSRWIGFYSPGAATNVSRGQLKKVPVGGGAPIVLCAADDGPFGARWGDDGTILFGQGEDGIWRVPDAGGTAERVVEANPGERLHGPQMLPGGEWVLFTAATGEWDDARIAVQSLSTGERETVLDGGRDARYLTTGHLVYARYGVLFAAAFDAERRRTLGGSVSLVEGIRTSGAATGASQFSLMANGTLVYLPGAARPESNERTLVFVDPRGHQEAVAMRGGPFLGLSLSPDGTRVALATDQGENRDVWVVELERGTLTRITTDPAPEAHPLWTPDGESLVFESLRDGSSAIYRKSPDGTGSAERVFALEGATLRPESFTPDGAQLLVTVGQDGKRDIGLLPWEPPGPYEPLIHTDADEGNASVSPDGRFIAYNSNESGQSQIYIQRFPDLGGRLTISIEGGFGPRWSPDGTALYYLGAPLGPPRDMMRVAIEHEGGNGSTLTPGRPETLFGWSFSDRNLIFSRYEPLPDGRFLVLDSANETEEAMSSPYDIVVVQNWIQELQERVPVP